MAIIKAGALVADIRGKVGTNVFSRNQGGAIVRDVGTWVQPDNEAQQACRDAIEALSQAWSNTLSEANRQTWRAYATTNPRPNRWGTALLTNGYACFIRHNFQEYLDNPVVYYLSAPTSNPIHPPDVLIQVQQAGAILVEGSTTPDVTGLFTFWSVYEGHPYWAGPEYLFTLWYNPITSLWTISPGIEELGESWWTSPSLAVPTWTPHGNANGTPTSSWTYDASLAKLTTPPLNYPDPPDGLTLFLYTGIPLNAGRSYYSGPFRKWGKFAPYIAAIPCTTWLPWTWPTRSVEPPWTWPPDGSGSARFYAIAQDNVTGSMSTRRIGTPTFGSLTPW